MQPLCIKCVNTTIRTVSHQDDLMCIAHIGSSAHILKVLSKPGTLANFKRLDGKRNTPRITEAHKIIIEMQANVPFSIAKRDARRLVPDIMHVPASEKQMQNVVFEFTFVLNSAWVTVGGQLSHDDTAAACL
ncbi:hypothetical protein CCR78_06960 [Rhodovulum imhoffii]|nr:hypothetical protein [Rhodovulum imhoffii]